MSNMKIISIIDHENAALRSDITRVIQFSVAAATQPLEQKLEQLQDRVKKLEEGVVNPLSI